MNSEEQVDLVNIRETEIIWKISEIHLACQMTVLDMELFVALNPHEIIQKDFGARPSLALHTLRENYSRVNSEIVSHNFSSQSEYLQIKF